MVTLDDGRRQFHKLRTTRRRDADREWYWLHQLPAMGFSVATPIGRQRRGRATILSTAGVSGRPLDAALADALRRGLDTGVRDYLCGVLAPVVRRLHGLGLVFRDLYCNHVFVDALDPAASPPVLIDVERVFRPRWRMRRWRVKDLAGLLASTPVPLPATWGVRFLRAYLEDGGEWRSWARAVTAKARRIRGHRPRYG